MNFNSPVRDTEALNKIQSLSIAIQNKGIATAFVTFSGHVSKIQCDVCMPAYNPKERPTHSFTAYLSGNLYDPLEVQDIINNLQSILNQSN